jgi:periplasmic protein-like
MLKIRCGLFILALSNVISAFSQEVKTYITGNAIEAMFIYVNGEIEHGLVERLEKMKKDGEITDEFRIVLNSPGGNLVEGLRLGYWIRNNNLSTEVGSVINSEEAGYDVELNEKGECYSACAIAFLGGVYRNAQAVPYLGFHRFYKNIPLNEMLNLFDHDDMAKNLADAQILDSYIVKYMVEMGVDARITNEYTNYGSDKVKIFTEEEAVKYNIVHSRFYEPYILEPYGNGVVASSRFLVPPRGYQRVEQITTFCRNENKKKIPRILLTAFGVDPNNQKEMEEEKERIKDYIENGAYINNSEIEGKKITSWIDKEGKVQFEILLPIELADSITKQKDLSVQLSTSRSSGIFSYEGKLSSREQKIIKSSFTHCINGK